MEDVRRQASLGTEFERLYNEDANIDRLLLAKVTNINYRYNTVDAQAISGNLGVNKSGQQGRYSAKLPVEFSGRTLDGKPYGQITPIEIGSLVLLGFINKSKGNPIVISVYNSSEESYELSRAPFSNADYRDEDLKQQSKHKFTVYPSLTYEDIDGNGNRTVSFTGKSFITIDGDSVPEMSGVNDDAFNYEDLDSSHYYSGELIEPTSKNAPTILFKHTGDRFDKSGEIVEDPHALMLFIDQDGTYRTSIVKDGEDWRTYTELDSNGEYTIRRQNDSNLVGKGDNYHELKVGEDGISMRSGNKYFLFNQDGISGNTSFGGGGGSSEDLTDLLNKVGDLDSVILNMGTKFEKTDEYIKLSAEKMEKIGDQIKDMGAEFEIRADKIEQNVTETITDLVNDSLKGISEDLGKLQETSLKAIESLSKLAEDGVLTALEKKIVLREWDMVRAEYPGYKQQAETMEVPTEEYDSKFNALSKYIKPILEDMESTTEIDRYIFNSNFQNYYVARGNLLYSVFEKMKTETDELRKKAIKASLDSAEALADAAKADAKAEQSKQTLIDIANDNKVTPHEKQQLLREYNQVLSEWEGIVEQAITYSVSSADFESAKDGVVNYIESSEVFKTMDTTTDIDGSILKQVFSTYFSERSKLLANVIATSKNILDGFSENLEYYHTQIQSTSKQISLVAESVKIMETEIEVSKAQLKIQADRISSRVTRLEMFRELNTSLDKLNSGGQNLYVSKESSEGSLKTSDGTVESSKSGSRVSNYIKVDGETDYIATVYDNSGLMVITVSWYDRNKKFISAIDSSGTDEQFSMNMISPKDATYARVSYSRANDTRLQFERGSVVSPYKSSREDMLDDISVATKERDNRKELVAYYEGRANTYKSTGIQDLDTVEQMSSDFSIKAVEKEKLKDIMNQISTDHTTIQGEASIYSVSTVALNGSFASLKDYTDELFEKMNTDSAVVNSTMTSVFSSYFEQRNRVYSNIVKATRESLAAVESILDEVTESSLRAQELAQKLAQDADSAARSVTQTRQNITEANQYETKAMKVITRIAQDSKLTPSEKVEANAIVETINEELQTLIMQAETYSLSTSDIENAVAMLSGYFSAFVTTDKVMEESNISPQSFKEYFQNYFTAKGALLQNVLDGAKGVYDKAQEDSSLAYKEFLRRQEQMVTYQNAVKDSKADIDRINGTIADLKDAVPYRYEITSTKGNIFTDNNVNTTIYVKLFKGNKDITDTIKPENFVWTKTNDDGTLDTVWNKAHIGVGNTIEVTHEDVDKKAIFEVEIFEEGVK